LGQDSGMIWHLFAKLQKSLNFLTSLKINKLVKFLFTFQ